MKNIVLIGMPGCGKSTLGRCLAERMGRDFIDADPEIEKDAGKTIPELFAVSEDFFRKKKTGWSYFWIVLRKISSVTWIQKQDPCWQQGGNESMICMRSGKHCTVRQQT